MKLIIAGTRYFIDRDLVIEAILTTLHKAGWKVEDIKEVLSGEAIGPDRHGAYWARQQGIRVANYPALWRVHGLGAGIKRNHQMGDAATHLLALWDGKSTGTKDMILYMKKLNKPYIVWTPPQMELDLSVALGLKEPKQVDLFNL